MGQPIDIHNTQSYEWASGCKAWVLHDSAITSIKEERMEAGTREQLHLHKQMEQFFYILEGQAIIYLNGQATHLSTGQGLSISALTPHYIANESDSLVRFLVISAPVMANGVDRENL